jgi:phosphoribosylaminoimidazole (AIR) synthetase
MFEVYNMGIGFCVISAEQDCDAILSILQRHARRAHIIGRIIEDPGKGVHLPGQRLVGHGKQFREQ